MNKFVNSSNCIDRVHTELVSMLKKELKQYISNYEMIPVGFNIRYIKPIETSFNVKFKLINGPLSNKMGHSLKRSNYTTLNYAFHIMADEELAKGLFKVKIIV